VFEKEELNRINRLPWKKQIIWSGVRGLPPALPLVEDVSLLILTPLVICPRTY
jgi:hypothetical protein